MMRVPNRRLSTWLGDQDMFLEEEVFHLKPEGRAGVVQMKRSGGKVMCKGPVTGESTNLRVNRRICVWLELKKNKRGVAEIRLLQ